MNLFDDDIVEYEQEAYVEPVFDLFKQLLPALDRNDYNYFQPGMEKHFWMLMRWLSASSDHPAYAVIATNEYVNMHWSVLTTELGEANHDLLRWQLMAAVGIGKTFRKWPGTPQRNRNLGEMGYILAQIFPGARTDEIRQIMDEHDPQELRDFAIKNGFEPPPDKK